MGQVFLQESAASKADGRNLAGMVEAVVNRMISMGILPFTIVAIMGPELFGLFLGARWTEAGVYAQILAPQLFIVFSVGSIMTLFGTLGKQELQFSCECIELNPTNSHTDLRRITTAGCARDAFHFHGCKCCHRSLENFHAYAHHQIICQATPCSFFAMCRL